MRQPCRITQSRHGVYCYRFQFTTPEGKRGERRYSLATKDPATAKRAALFLSAMLATKAMRQPMSAQDSDDFIREHTQAFRNLSKQTEKLARELNGLPPPDTDQDSDPLANLAKELGKDAKELRAVISRANGDKIELEADPNNPADMQALLTLHQQLTQSSGTQSTTPQATTSAAGPITGGMTLDEAIARYATRQAGKKSAKSLYEYGNHQKKFKAWLEKRKGSPNTPIHSVTRSDVAAWIDDLIATGSVSLKTIKSKQLPAIGGLFELAQSVGSYPEGQQLPTHGHKLLTKQEEKKGKSKRGWKIYTDEDLQRIFNPDAYMAQKNPTDYWLPLLALFTGGRISELCQLLTTNDIKQVGSIWAISITDEDLCQQLKTPAAKRTIPIHPRLIELGFLDFVEDMKPYGGLLFPYLTRDPFGYYSGTPSERFGKYMDEIGITDPKKVFHSFRGTSNNRLKQQGVPEETRCQFVGHEHDTVNSAVYSEAHTVQFLMEHAASKLDFDLPFDRLRYPRTAIVTATKNKVAIKQRREAHNQAATKRTPT